MRLINTEYLHDTCGDDTDLLIELLTLFHEQVSTIGGRLQELLDCGEWERLGREAHKFKASALAFGMSEMGDALKKAEMLGKGIAIEESVATDAELYGKQISALPQETKEWVEAALAAKIAKKSLADLIIFCNLQSQKATEEVAALLQEARMQING